MKKVLFYIHNGWVFGKIHNELIKALHNDVYCDILCWTQRYTEYQFKYLLDKYDYFLSTPHGCCSMFDTYKVPLERMIGVIHQDWDIYQPIQAGTPKDYFNKFAGYAVIAPLLQNISLSHGISRIPDLLRIGLFQDNYPKNEANEPKNIGYFAKYARFDQGFDVKRGNLVEKIASKSGLNLIKNEGVNFLGAEMLYKDIDLMVCSSLVEGNPYPMLEAFACGIPVLGTPTGITTSYLSNGGGKILPLKAEELVYQALYEIEKMKSDRSYYKKLANESYEIGRAIDWSIIKEEWINYINNLP